ncbi:hypothetical protein KIN20_005229 [Parelaphostrongylus tenuis]|uniref:Uncharacterized protein n=1 Tax=Parelaphostrongylus tenuis TaxID=148309 RepID=A0AAD5QF05_PARTN|nr:hypothetical protein KIN20_005229 [Parelaphostrongylus tenuis]
MVAGSVSDPGLTELFIFGIGDLVPHMSGKTIDVYEMLESLDMILMNESQPVLTGKEFRPISIMNMMLGIWDYVVERTIWSSLYFFLGHIIVSFGIIGLCYRIDGIVMKNSDIKPAASSGRYRDILLDYRDHLANGDHVNQKLPMKICSMDKPPPPEHLRKELLYLLQHPYPSLSFLAFFISSAVFLAYLRVFFIPGTTVYKEFITILDFCATIAPFSSDGLSFEYVFWILELIALIVFNYTVYSLSLMFLDTLQWIFGIKEEYTPILID